MMDVARFLTKEEASQRAGVSTKTLEEWNKAGRLAKATRQRDGRGPHQTVYDPDDLAVIVAERRTAPPTSLVAPGRNGNGHRHDTGAADGLARPAADPVLAAGFFQALTEALVTALGAKSAKSENPASESSQTLYVTVKAAAAILGLPQADVLTMIHEGDLPHRLTRRGGVRIRRKDLEQV